MFMIHPLTKPYFPKASVSLLIIVKQEVKILHSEKKKKAIPLSQLGPLIPLTEYYKRIQPNFKLRK
jgi:hypothetical protein